MSGHTESQFIQEG